MIHIIIGVVWGLNEGLWFFIVPDLCLSYSALKGWRAAVVGCLGVVLGSMLAAILLYFGLWLKPEWAENLQMLWSKLPGYYPKMFTVAGEHLNEHGAQGLLSGPSSGIPYRFYIFEAIQQKISIANILAWTPIARLERIVIAPLVVLVLRALAKKWFEKSKAQADRNLLLLKVSIAIYWMIIYVWYWRTLLPGLYGSASV